MKTTYILIGSIGFIIFVILIYSFGAEKVEASGCWRRANGQYTFGDKNSGYETETQCFSAYTYYKAFPNGENICTISPIEEGQELECSIVGGNYDMTESRPVTQSNNSTCTTYTRNDWKVDLHSKVDNTYSEFLERPTNPTDYNYWEFKIPYAGCSQVVDESIIRNQVEKSEERANLLLLKKNAAIEKEIPESPEIVNESVDREENKGVLTFIISLPSVIWNMVLKIWR